MSLLHSKFFHSSVIPVSSLIKAADLNAYEVGFDPWAGPQQIARYWQDLADGMVVHLGFLLASGRPAKDAGFVVLDGVKRVRALQACKDPNCGVTFTFEEDGSVRFGTGEGLPLSLLDPDARNLGTLEMALSYQVFQLLESLMKIELPCRHSFRDISPEDIRVIRQRRA